MLDPFSLLLVFIVNHIIGTLVFAVAWFIERSVPGVGHWALGRLLVTVGLVLVLFRSSMSNTGSVLLVNILIFVGVYLSFRGSQLFMSRRALPHMFFITLFVVAMAAISYWTIVEDSYADRLTVSSTLLILFYGLSAMALWPRGHDEVFISGKLVAVVFALNVPVHVWKLYLSMTGAIGAGVFDAQGYSAVLYFIGIATSMLTAMGSITMMLEYLHNDLKKHAERDPLTGVYNRRAFYPLAENVLARHERDGGVATMVMMDLDHFKTVNDTHGHAAGDEVLKRAVAVTQRELRGQDVLVRLGGEEFGILLPSTSERDALLVAERIRKAIKDSVFTHKDRDISITASLGLTSLIAAKNKLNIDELISQADEALYKAKQNGRNRIYAY